MGRQIKRPVNLDDSSVNLGFKCLDEYFALNWKKTFAQMASELDTTYQRVSREYRKYLKRAEYKVK